MGGGVSLSAPAIVLGFLGAVKSEGFFPAWTCQKGHRREAGILQCRPDDLTDLGAPEDAPALHCGQHSLTLWAHPNFIWGEAMRQIRAALCLKSCPMLLATLVIVIASCSAIVPGNNFAAAASQQNFSIRMTISDLHTPGAFWTNDDLRLTVNVFFGSSRAQSGVVNVTSNDPHVRQVCGITIGPRWPNHCGLGFPNSGTWTIKAQYEKEYALPAHYLHTQTLRIRIRAASTTTTQPQEAAQATITKFSPESYNQVVVTTYDPTEIATVQDATGSYSPEAGTVTFTDANGSIICTAQVEVDFASECTGIGRSSPPPNPIIAHYSGTKIGSNDGLGSWYAPSSATAYGRSESCSQC